MTEEELIAIYKQELTSEAELARGDLDEIEDHLRALAADLRNRGMPGIEAVREACRRLGDPRAVAREHARVRSPFGARISRVRAYSAVALVVPILVYGGIKVIPYAGVGSLASLQLVLYAIVTVALAMRLTWARPIVLGGIACSTVVLAHGWRMIPHGNPMWLVAYVGVIAFVMPWRRRELTTTGWALALNVWACKTATFGLIWQLSTADGGQRYLAPAAVVAFAATICASCGNILRARWSAVAASLATLALCATVFEFLVRFEYLSSFTHGGMAILLSGLAAAAVSTLLSWRGALSRLGTFRYVLD